MAQVWLRSNRRVLLLALVPAFAIAALGALVVVRVENSLARGLGGALVVAGLALCWGLSGQVRRPASPATEKTSCSTSVPAPGRDSPAGSRGVLFRPRPRPFACRRQTWRKIGQSGGTIIAEISRVCRGKSQERLGTVGRALSHASRDLVRTARRGYRPSHQQATPRGATTHPSGVATCRRRSDDGMSAPLLLVSVRDRAEAELAVLGGADWIDLKEPCAGPLGAVGQATAWRVAEAIPATIPLSAACGELCDWPRGCGSATTVDSTRELSQVRVGGVRLNWRIGEPCGFAHAMRRIAPARGSRQSPMRMPTLPPLRLGKRSSGWPSTKAHRSYCSTRSSSDLQRPKARGNLKAKRGDRDAFEGPNHAACWT